MANEYSIVSATFPKRAQARRIARLLVEKQLAACVQIIPIDSVYRWMGEIYEESEVKLLIKSRTMLFDEIATLIKENHSYEVPEIVQIPITGGSEDYLKWIDDSTPTEEWEGS